MTAPDLLQVIAVALHWHDIGIDPETGPVCICGENLSHLDNTEEHQAAVILKAISEAGTVEWGVWWDRISEIYPERTDWAQSPEAAQATIDKSFATGSVVTRIAAGPWTAVETP